MTQPAITKKKLGIYDLLNASLLVGVITAFVGLSLYLHIGHELSEKKFVTVHGKNISADLVRHEIKQITKFGPRIYPNKNNQKAGKYILEKLKQKLYNKPKDSMFDGEVEFFQADGYYDLTIIRRLTYMGYKKIPNVILTLRPKSLNKKYTAGSTSDAKQLYCMYNCHYDSVNGSPGASDNALNCALMMNLVDYFLDMKTSDFDQTTGNSKYKTLPQCNLLFLFNGAEETCMAAANGFITKHNLKDKIKTLVNLDSSGTGGRAALFQTTPGATLLMDIYAKSVPHPFGSVLGEEIFRTGLLPVDTDFQIFRDYGHLEGLDIAFIGNGHQYHNEFDSEENIPDGTILNEIENLFNLAHGILFDERLNEKKVDHEDYTYFDIAHQIMIIHPASIGFKINMFVIVFAVSLMCHEVKHVLLKIYSVKSVILMMTVFIFAHLLSYIFTLLNIFTLSLVMTVIQAHLSWYSYYFMAFFLYGIPSLVLFVSLEFSFINGTFNCETLISNDEKRNCQVKDTLMFWSMCFFPIFILSVATYNQVRSSFIVCFALVTILLIRVVQFILTGRPLAKFVKWSDDTKEVVSMLVMVVGIAPFTIMLACILSGFFEAVIPIFDRTPCEVPSETIMSMVVCLFCLLSFFVVLISMFRFERIFNFLRRVFFVLWIVVMVLVVSGLVPPFVPVKAPKRILLSHADHKIFDRNFNLVENTGKMIYIASDQRCLNGFGDELAKSLTPLCQDNPFCFSVHPFCLLDEYRSSIFYKMVDKLPNTSDSHDIDLNLLKIRKVDPPTDAAASVDDNSSSYYNISLSMTGADIMSIDFVMNNYLDIVDWSFDLKPHANSKTNEGYPLYNILYLFDGDSTTLHFSLLVKASPKANLKIDNFNVILVQHLVNEFVTTEIQKVIDGFEDFVATTHDRIRWNTYPIYLQN